MCTSSSNTCRLNIQHATGSQGKRLHAAIGATIMAGAMSLNRVMALIGKSVVSDWRRGFAAYPLVVGIERANKYRKKR